MTSEERAAEAVEHLQAAARELIAAARVLLDLAEEVVENPGPVLHLIGELAAPLVARGRGSTEPERDGGAPPRAPRVQHIRVS